MEACRCVCLRARCRGIGTVCDRAFWSVISTLPICVETDVCSDCAFNLRKRCAGKDEVVNDAWSVFNYRSRPLKILFDSLTSQNLKTSNGENYQSKPQSRV